MASSAEDMPPSSDTNNASSTPMLSSTLDDTSSITMLTHPQSTSAASSPDIDPFSGDANDTTDSASSMNVSNTKRKRGNSSLPEPNDQLFQASDSDSDPDEHVPKKLKTAAETTAAKAVEGQKKDYFPFMELPREIRDIIYHWTFHERTPPCLGLAAQLEWYNLRYGSHHDTRASYLRVHANLGLTTMDRQTRAESMRVLMSRPYTFYSPEALLSFLESVGPPNRPFLKDICLDQWNESGVIYPDRRAVAALRQSAFSLLAEATSLRRFSVESNLWMGHGDDEMGELAKCCFDEMHGVFKVISRREGPKDAGMEVFHFSRANFFDEVGGAAVCNAPRKAIFEAELRKLLLKADW